MENMDYDVGKAFAAIENELLDSMMRNMKRHRAEETKEGFHWEQWQAKQLAGLEEYRRKHKGKLEERYEAINSKMRMAILQANAQGKMAQEKKILEAIRKGAKLHRATDKLQGEFFRVNDRKMNALLDAVESDMKRAENAILRMHDDKVRRAIFNAQVYANSGAGTYEKAVDMAVKDYAAAGINCIRYKDGKQVNIKSYARMALKTAGLRAYLTGEGAKRQEWGIHTVIINKRGNPCPLCLPWVGRVMIDDVWSGGTAAEAKKMGYPLISQAMKAGLYHPNCRDSHTTYFPGISTPPDKKWKKSELAAVEKNVKQEARRQYAERQEEKFDRLERCAIDPENKRVYAIRRKEWLDKTKKAENAKLQIEAENEQITLLKKYGNLANIMLNGTSDDMSKWSKLQRISGKTEKELLSKMSESAGNWETLLKMQSESTMKPFLSQLLDVATDTELGALNLWSGTTYVNINRYLRFGINVDDISKNAAKNIETVLNKTATPKEIIVRRGTGTKEIFQKMVGDWKSDPSVLTGQEFSDAGFVATSPMKEGGFSGVGENQAELFIRVPEGTHGAYIAHEAHNELEKEFLLQKGYTYRIIKAEYRSNPIFPEEKDLKVWCEVILNG